MLTPQDIQRLKAQTLAKTGQSASQPMDVEQAKAAFSSSQDNSTGGTRNLAQKALGTFIDPIVKGGVRLGQAAGSAIAPALGIPPEGVNKAMNTDIKVPFLGTDVPAPSKDTPENVTGRAIGTVALGLGPVAGGAAIGAGNAMENDKGVGASIAETVAGALGGKILEFGFNAVAPYIEKAAEHYGAPLIEKISQYVPDSAKGFMEKLSQKIPSMPEKIMPQAASDFINKGAQKVSDIAEKPFNAAGEKISSMIPSKQEAPAKALEAITPKTSELTLSEYEDLVSKGKITPKTMTSPAQYVPSEAEKAIAEKYAPILQSKDPVENSMNVMKEVINKDTQVGNFLRKNNSIFNDGELKNEILKKLSDVTDVTVDETRLDKLKNTLTDNFIKNLPKNDMETLWKSRKAFDRSIEKAFNGSPTLQNTVKREFRNAVQDFIANHTPEGEYKGYMKDMSQLLDVNETLLAKAAKEKNFSALRLWLKQNPVKAKIIGGITGYEALKKFGILP